MCHITLHKKHISDLQGGQVELKLNSSQIRDNPKAKPNVWDKPIACLNKSLLLLYFNIWVRKQG
jgi:hypothetical protein